MAFRLPRLRPESPITSNDKPNGLFMQWWQSVVSRLETVITDLQTQTDALTGVDSSITGLQAHSNILDALAGLGTDTGLLEKTGAAAFNTHTIGTAAPTEIPNTAKADARYLRQDGTVSASAATTTHKLSVSIGGSTYYILLSNV